MPSIDVWMNGVIALVDHGVCHGWQVWDVLSNEEVVKIVSSVRRRSEAAKKLVKKAVRAWEIKHPLSRIDDCAAICLFLKPGPGARVDGGKRSRDLSTSGSFTTSMSGGVSKSSDSTKEVGGGEEWGAPDGARRANSRFAGILKRCSGRQVGK